MTTKTWNEGDIRRLARATVDGRRTVTTARGDYFRALIGTAQGELDGKADQAAQLAALKAVHRKFYAVVWDAIATDTILAEAGIPKQRYGKERNRRLNFARSSYGTIRRWLRAHGHDLMKLNAKTATKSQLENDAPPTRKHALTQERIQKKATKLVDGLVQFANTVAKADERQAVLVLDGAIRRLMDQIAARGAKPTGDAAVAVREMRPLKLGRNLFLPARAA